MQVQGYGVVLSRLTEGAIEMVRTWRNSDNINRYMEYREQITPAMQQQWFSRLNPLNDFYFVIEYQGKPIGLIHTSHINRAAKTANAGLFIYDERYIGTPIPVLASLTMVDAMFGMFSIENIYAKVMRDNEIAVRYNVSLGFAAEEGQDEKPFQRYILTRDAYYKATAALRKLAKIESENSLLVNIPFELFDTLNQQGLINENPPGVRLLVESKV